MGEAPLTPGGRTAWLAGATGLIGGALLDLLLDEPSYARVTVFSRRAPARSHPKLEARVGGLGGLEEAARGLKADDAFCCLGTTMAKAGSREAFRRVDEGYVLAFARAAREAEASRFLLVSAVGADPSAAAFYSRVKGEVDRAVLSMGFPSTTILRPSLLLGERAEPRLVERLAAPVMRALSPLLLGRLRRYRPIAGAAVARAMLRLALDGTTGPRVLDYDAISDG